MTNQTTAIELSQTCGPREAGPLRSVCCGQTLYYSAYIRNLNVNETSHTFTSFTPSFSRHPCPYLACATGPSQNRKLLISHTSISSRMPHLLSSCRIKPSSPPTSCLNKQETIAAENRSSARRVVNVSPELWSSVRKDAAWEGGAAGRVTL